MPQIKVKEMIYGNFGKCVELSNGTADLVVTVDVGPRIIRFGLTGKENEFCEDAPAQEKTEYGTWYLRGGHRLWHSPETSPRTYAADNDPVEWFPIENGIKVIQKTEPWVQIQKEMEITMAGCCNKVQVIHRLTNKNAWPVELSAWALSVMARGGMEIVPQPQRSSGFLANRILALWPYAKMNDPRVMWGDKYITLKQDSKMKNPFKFGISNEDGWAAYFNHGNLFIKRYPHRSDAIYPDFGVSYETYTIDFMLEMESLSPVTKLEPDASISHLEEWELVGGVLRPDNNEEAIDQIVQCYILGCAGCGSH